MDPSVFLKILDDFDELRMERLQIAQEFVGQYQDTELLLADLANILALLFAANRMMHINKGFTSDSR